MESSSVLWILRARPHVFPSGISLWTDFIIFSAKIKGIGHNQNELRGGNISAIQLVTFWNYIIGIFPFFRIRIGYLPRNPLIMCLTVIVEINSVPIYHDQDFRSSASAGDHDINVFRRCICVIPKLLAERPVRSHVHIKTVSEYDIGCRKGDVLILAVANIGTIRYALPRA